MLLLASFLEQLVYKIDFWIKNMPIPSALDIILVRWLPEISFLWNSIISIIIHHFTIRKLRKYTLIWNNTPYRNVWIVISFSLSKIFTCIFVLLMTISYYFEKQEATLKIKRKQNKWDKRCMYSLIIQIYNLIDFIPK